MAYFRMRSCLWQSPRGKRPALGPVFFLVCLAVLRRLADLVALEESLNAAGGVDDALLAREVRVAGAAYVEVDALLGGVRLPGVPARAGDGSFNVTRVNLFFHVLSRPDEM
jgi:hypothetical protein